MVNSEVGRNLARAHELGAVSEVDLRIGVGCGEVVFDLDVWTGQMTPEGSKISEAKRVEAAAEELATDTRIW